MTKINSKIQIDDEFFVGEKTSDVFKEVVFHYDKEVWHGVLPKLLVKQGLDLGEADFNDSLEGNYELLNPQNRKKWIEDSDAKWRKKDSETYKVLLALYSGKWECRVCGPVPKVNPQPAARLGALKKLGYIIGSKRRACNVCNKKTMHDILIMLPDIESRFEDGNELRAPMSETLKARIKKVLDYKEVCFDVKRSPVELIIDHKFPSQRWNVKESANPNDMSEQDIKKKFQLLTNQTNMWKSRHCDHCVKHNIRGDFMGINWYYAGNEKWNGKDANDEKGCIGCPWYDLEEWKSRLEKRTK